MVFDIGVRLIRTAACEGAQLRRRHAHRPTALENILHPNLGLTPPTIGQRVERLHALHFKDRADLQMVLQIGAHTGQIDHGIDAMLFQHIRRPQTRELQNLWRANTASAQNYSMFSHGADISARTRPNLDATATRLTVSVVGH